MSKELERLNKDHNENIDILNIQIETLNVENENKLFVINQELLNAKSEVKCLKELNEETIENCNQQISDSNF